MEKLPKWASPDRQTALVNLFVESGGFCVFGHRPCHNPTHHYEHFIEGLIKKWIQDDRELREAIWQEFQRQVKHWARRYPIRGDFNAEARDSFFDRQPSYYLLGLGINALTFKPFAKLRLPSGFVHLFVDLADTLKPLGKNKKRKAIRYGKPLPKAIQDKVDNVCRLAVRDYLK